MFQSGFSLIQLLASLVVITMLTLIGVPVLQALARTQQQQVMAHDLASALKFGRLTAVMQENDVVVRAIDNDWSRGWTIWTDPNGNGEPAHDEPVLLEQRRHGHVRVVGNTLVKRQVRFIAMGQVAARGAGPGNGTLHICDRREAVSQWRVIVNVTGRVRIESGDKAEVLCEVAAVGSRVKAVT